MRIVARASYTLLLDDDEAFEHTPADPKRKPMLVRAIGQRPAFGTPGRIVRLDGPILVDGKASTYQQWDEIPTAELPEHVRFPAQRVIDAAFTFEDGDYTKETQ